MDEQQHKTWWPLHLRVALGEQLPDEDARVYQAGLAELEAEEWAALRPAAEQLRALQEQWRALTARNQQLAQEEAVLRARAAELESNYRALTGEPLGLEI